MTILITANHNVADGYISISHSKWSIADWNYILFWCLENLDKNDWIPMPQKKQILIKPEAYFLFKLTHGSES